jgi:hypothetical protein
MHNRRKLNLLLLLLLLESKIHEEDNIARGGANPLLVGGCEWVFLPTVW